MAINPQYQLGRHLISCVVTPQTVAANGALTDGTGITISAVMESTDQSLRPTNEEISPINSTRDNMVRVSDGHFLSLSILKVNGGTDPAPLRTAILAGDIFKVVIVEGTGTSARTTTAYYTRGEYNDGFQGKGKQIARLSLEPVDVGASSFGVAS